MNFGAFFVLLKLAMDSGFTVSPKTNGPTTPTVPTDVSIRPTCGPGRYAYQDPLSKLWSCVLIPKGR